MKLMQPQKRPLNDKCRHCQRAIKARDVVFHQRMPNNSFGDRDMFFHVRCMAKLLRDGMEADEAIAHEAAAVFNDEIANVRQRILETGDPFVDC